MTTADLERRLEWRNLAPDLVRQRVMIEGTTREIVGPDKICDYLIELSKVLQMQVLREPFAYQADELGFGGWIHWRTSGAHFYSYPGNGERLPLFSVDAYTCKPFSVEDAVVFTRDYLAAVEMVYQEIKV